MVKFVEKNDSKLKENFQPVATNLFIVKGIYVFLINSGKRKYKTRDIEDYLDTLNLKNFSTGDKMFLSSAVPDYYYDLYVSAIGNVSGKLSLFVTTL